MTFFKQKSCLDPVAVLEQEQFLQKEGEERLPVLADGFRVNECGTRIVSF